jgi:cytochrome c553
VRLILVLVMMFSASVYCASDAIRGEKLYKRCASCHGIDAMGKKSQKAPMLAGQFDWYILTQLKAIKDKVRNNKNTAKMYPFVKKLTDDDFSDLAAYISTLAVKK